MSPLIVYDKFTTLADKTLVIAESHIGEGLRAGDDIYFGAGVTIDGYATIGRTAYFSDKCYIGPRSEIGENATFGDGCIIDGMSRIGDGAVFEERVRIGAGVELGRRVEAMGREIWGVMTVSAPRTIPYISNIFAHAGGVIVMTGEHIIEDTTGLSELHKKYNDSGIEVMWLSTLWGIAQTYRAGLAAQGEKGGWE